MLTSLAKNPKIDPWHRSNYAGLPNQAGEIVSLKDLDAPLRRKKPARIGVQLMGDLFHENISFNVIDTVFSVFNLCPHHTFVVLTKRPERMLEWYNQADILGWGNGCVLCLCKSRGTDSGKTKGGTMTTEAQELAFAWESVGMPLDDIAEMHIEMKAKLEVSERYILSLEACIAEVKNEST